MLTFATQSKEQPLAARGAAFSDTDAGKENDDNTASSMDITVLRQLELLRHIQTAPSAASFQIEVDGFPSKSPFEDNKKALKRPKGLSVETDAAMDFSFLTVESFLEQSFVEAHILYPFDDNDARLDAGNSELKDFLRHIRPFSLDMIGVEEVDFENDDSVQPESIQPKMYSSSLSMGPFFLNPDFWAPSSSIFLLHSSPFSLSVSSCLIRPHIFDAPLLVKGRQNKGVKTAAVWLCRRWQVATGMKEKKAAAGT
jgi:hypothetical protein